MPEQRSDGVDESFTPTQLVEPLTQPSPPELPAEQPQRPDPPAPPVPATAPAASRRHERLTAQLRTLSGTVRRTLRRASTRLLRGGTPPVLSRPRLGATVFVVLVSALLAWRSVQSDGRAADVAAAETTRPEVRAALQRDDSVAVLALLRTDDSSSALMLRADAALRIGRPAEAFDLLEKAVRVDGSVRSSAAFARIAIATLSAVPSSRVGSLVKDAASEEVRAELRKALSATEYRKRHGAQHVLTLLGEQVNEAPILYLDLMQLSDCDARRAVAKTLVRRNPDAPDLRDVLALARARDRDGCLEGIGLPEETASR